MAREVTHAATGPRKLGPEDVDPEKGDVAVCMCGLSEEYPFCDGSHRRTLDEDSDTTYKYVDGERRVVESVVFADEEEEESDADDDGTTADG